jgi:hypothetical protein
MLELLSDPVEVITSDDLDALEGGSVTNEKGTFKYDQFIVLSESGLTGTNSTDAYVMYGVDTDQSDDPAVYLKFVDNYRVYTYRLSFPTALKTDVDASDDLEDLDNKKITLLGTEYSIINTDNNTGTLELMGGAISDTLQEYEKKTYNLNGKDYEVEVVAISGTSEVIMKVNGEVTEKKLEGETVKLSDGTEIGIKTVLENEGTEAGGGDLVTFYLGASKIVLKDADWSSGNTDGTLEVASDTVEDVVVDIVGSRNTGAGSYGENSISKIEIIWTADDDYYVPIGGKLSEQLSGDDKNKLFLKNLDFKFAAVQQGTTREIKVQNGGSDKYKVTFPTLTGGTLGENMFYVVNETGTTHGCIGLGKEATRPLVTATGTNLSKNYRFLVSSNKYSHLLEVGSFSTSDSKVTIKDLGTGESFDVSVVGNDGTMYIDGYAYSFNAYLSAEKIQFDSFGTDGAGVAYTPEEFKLTFGTSGICNTTEGNAGTLIVQEYKEEDGDGGNRETITVSVTDGGTDDKMTVGNVVSSDGNFSFLSWDSKDDYSTAYTEYGTLVEWDTDGTQDAVTMHIGDEAIAEVFITSGVTQVVSGGEVAEGVVTTTTVNEIQVGSAVLDTEISDVTADNYISVGGPCANSVSARLVGVAQKIPECLSGLSLSEGEGVVKLFENGGKVSMLVAGATALDSQRAARVVAQNDKYPEFTGMEVSVTGTSLSDITVSAPAPMAEADDEMEE